MYANTGYLWGADVDEERTDIPLAVVSCGNYKLRKMPVLKTVRPYGRKDYQMMYVASGNVYYMEENRQHTALAGSLILFPPNIPQNYMYYREEQTEVYWVHFTGNRAEDTVREVFGGVNAACVLPVGRSSAYPYLYLQMIHELQMKKPCFEELLELRLREQLALAKRYQREALGADWRMKKEVETAVRYFNENYSKPVNISEYAKAQNMSTCWFIRSFRQYTGMPPLQYLTKIRMAKAASLLESTNYNVGEIGAVVGYENPLYFSRIFKKQTGYSPAEYRKRRLGGGIGFYEELFVV